MSKRKSPIVMNFNVVQTQVLEPLINGQKIQAIKVVRELTGLGLKEAKDLVETGKDPTDLHWGKNGLMP